jgi:DNA-binding MltR family transcriptional regulator
MLSLSIDKANLLDKLTNNVFGSLNAKIDILGESIGKMQRSIGKTENSSVESSVNPIPDR